MANHPSAEKRNRQRIARTARNRAVESTVRSSTKAVRTAIEAGEKAAAQKALQTAISQLGKAATKGVVPRKAASRSVSRLSAAVHKMS